MEDLYALPPEQFVAARDAAARSDKALRALRRPTVSAWLVNTLVRREPELVGQLLSLGPELAAAQQAGDGAALRTLGEQRRSLVEATVDRAVELSGRPATAAAREEVAGTLEAALADPASAEAVRSGRLVRPLAYAGFGEVDLSGAVAALPRTDIPATDLPEATPSPDRRRDARQLRALEAAALTAAGALDDAVADARTAAERATELARQVEAAESQATAAQETVRVAQEAADVARAALDAARRG